MTIIYDPRRISRLLRRCAYAAAALLCTLSVSAHDPAGYAASSVLADGNWGKIRVSQTGIQFVSASTLRQLGFQDPQKVNVYGFGGRLQEDALRESDPDDLPMLPSVKSADGIWFFGGSGGIASSACCQHHGSCEAEDMDGFFHIYMGVCYSGMYIISPFSS